MRVVVVVRVVIVMGMIVGLAGSIGHGIELARATIASGAARAKMDAFVATTRRLANS